tara:strand:+ start:565 stop:2076 length:1512 start_codon:yes stop_codon:yes gene_type:complete
MTNPLYDSLFGKHETNKSPFLKLLNGKIICFESFLCMSRRFANTLFSMGLCKGDRVAIQVEKSPESLAIYAACVQSGLVFLPLNISYTPSEIKFFLEDSQAKLFIGMPSKQKELFAITEKSDVIFETLDSRGNGSFIFKSNKMSDKFNTIDRNIEDLVAILYTSGTTGKPKGAMLSQKNLISNAEVLVNNWKFSDKDVLLHVLPIYHTHGLFVATNVTLLAGGSILFFSKFNLDEVIKNISNSTVMMGVPTIFTRLLSDIRFNRKVTKNIRLFISGSAPLLSKTHFEFENRTGHRILERYGMTETNMNTSNPYEGERRAGTVGLPLPGVELRIVDKKTGKILTDGQIGEIEIKGENVFKGYWNMPFKTSKEFCKDGFFKTGDIGRTDEDGYLYISGRSKDVIITGGLNVYPKEIEIILDRQKDVLESAVIGIPESDLGEAVVGIIVPKKNSSPNLEKIDKTIKKELAKFKNPRKYFIVKKLPRNSMGKIQKNILREEYKDTFL